MNLKSQETRTKQDSQQVVLGWRVVPTTQLADESEVMGDKHKLWQSAIRLLWG